MAAKPLKDKLDSLCKAHRTKIEKALEQVLPSEETHPGALGIENFYEAVRHAVKAGGKRIRPILTLLCAKACGATPKQMKDALRAAVAIELLHSYTLVHDDLPAMDNDTLRRGEPTVWAKYGEGTAILVGDYLQAMAFEQLNDCANAADLYAQFSLAAKKVVCGQIADIAATKIPSEKWNQELLNYVYLNKTACLIATACAMGGIVADVPHNVLQVLFEYGAVIGMTFQYVDDLLDAEQAKEGNELSALAVEGNDEAELQGTITFLTMRASALLRTLPGDVEPLARFTNALSFRRK